MVSSWKESIIEEISRKL